MARPPKRAQLRICFRYILDAGRIRMVGWTGGRGGRDCSKHDPIFVPLPKIVDRSEDSLVPAAPPDISAFRTIDKRPMFVVKCLYGNASIIPKSREHAEQSEEAEL